MTVHRPPDRQAAGPGRALNLWTLVVAAHKRAADIRVLALPGASTDEILLARARGPRRMAPVARPAGTGAGPELSVWLRASNLAVVDDIPNKLAVVGLQLCQLAEGGRPWPPGWPENSELQLLAEMEHGRFTVERLLSGWARGSRDPGRFLSPYLRPWKDLDDATKQYDCEVIRDLPDVLTEVGLGHAPLPPAS